MSRPISSDILFPFIPGTSINDHIKGIKNVILVVYGTPIGTESIPAANNRSFASLYSHNAGPRILTFRAYESVGNDDFLVREIVFNIADTVAGFGSVKSNDGYSALFVAYGELVSFVATHNPLDYVVEPCNIRWLHSAVTEVVMVNEERLSKPEERIDLDNNVVYTFNEGGPIYLLNGYNVDLEQDTNDLQILGSAGAGLGMAPDNMWDDTVPPTNIKALKIINGQGPEQDGDFFIETTDSISLQINGNQITIIDSAEKVE